MDEPMQIDDQRAMCIIGGCSRKQQTRDKSDYTKTDTAATDGMKAFMALRAQAEANGLADMSLDEINEEIKATRKERKARRKI